MEDHHEYTLSKLRLRLLALSIERDISYPIYLYTHFPIYLHGSVLTPMMVAQLVMKSKQWLLKRLLVSPLL